MSDIFQLPVGDGAGEAASPFKRFGLARNPFPDSGVDSGVLYTDHMKDELRRINAWIASAAGWSLDDPAPKFPPLAIFGSLGVGKTHLLNYLEKGLSRNPLTPALRKGLADEGMTRLVLADLFLRYLPLAGEDAEPGIGLLRLLVRAAREDPGKRAAMRNALRAGSPVQIPFFAAVESDGDEAIAWLSRWIRREYTTPAQRSRLGVAGVLESEGEAVRAVADLMRLARVAGLIRAWFVLIDQLEELWRPDVITPVRRARFLTDLRHLVDEALEGAPIALILAWNTTVDERLQGVSPGDRMRRDYYALWQRLDRPVDLPPLRREDLWPFARKYLEAAGVGEQSPGRQRRLFDLLQAAAPEIEAKQTRAGPSGMAPRKVLAAWREKAEEIALRGD